MPMRRLVTKLVRYAGRRDSGWRRPRATRAKGEPGNGQRSGDLDGGGQPQTMEGAVVEQLVHGVERDRPDGGEPAEAGADDEGGEGRPEAAARGGDKRYQEYRHGDCEDGEDVALEGAAIAIPTAGPGGITDTIGDPRAGVDFAEEAERDEGQGERPP